MRFHGKVLMAGLVGLGVCMPIMGQQTPPKAAHPQLEQLNEEMKDLYAQATASMVRVTVVQSPLAVLHGTLKSEFDDWVKTPAGQSSRAAAAQGGRGGGQRGGRGGDGSGRGGDATGRGGGGGGARGDGPRMAGPGAGPGPGGPGGGGNPRGGGAGAALSQQVADFLVMKAGESTDPAAAAQLRGLAFKVGINRNGFQGEMLAVLVDATGHALLPVGLIREAHTTDDLRVTLPDSSTTTATFIGASAVDGYTVIKLARVGAGSKPVKFSTVKRVPGEFLISFPAGAGAPGFVIATPRNVLSPFDDRFAIATDERNGAFVFNVEGEMGALVSGGGAGWLGERQALSGARVQRGVEIIIRDGRDLEPRQVGFLYAQDLPKDRLEAITALLRGRRGVLVTQVSKGSVAENSGIKPGDVIVSINGRSVQELLTPDGKPLAGYFQLGADLATKPGGVAAGVIRQESGKEVEVQLTPK